MKPIAHIAIVMTAVIAVVCVVMLVPSANADQSSWWMDDIMGAITFYKEGGHYKKDYPRANWDPYLEQIQLVRERFQKGDGEATYAAMNRFMDMLEAREGEIPAQAAHELFNFCNLVTPGQFHDVERHRGDPKMEQPRLPKRSEDQKG